MTSPASPTLRPTSPWPRRLRRFGAAVALGLVGGLLGLSLGGTVNHDVGPLATSMRVLPTWQGGTTVEIPPLGELVLDTHAGPLGLRASLEGVDVEAAQRLLKHPSLLSGLQTTLETDLVEGLRLAVLRSLLMAALGAVLLSALVMRRVRDTLVGSATAVTAMGASFAVAFATWNPASISEPRYTGLLTSAPSVVGSADQIVSEFSMYGDQLAHIVQNVTGLYTVTSQLPILPPEEDLVRILHVSDLHLAPQAWDVIRTVAKQYRVDMVVDSGDITDHGSGPENRYVREIRHIDVPYIWVRGNHDSMVTERAMRQLDNVVVLDGSVRTVKGLRFLGAGDPTFTPDKSLVEAGPEAVTHVAEGLAATAEADGDVDVVVYHDPTSSSVFDGHASMVLSGHLHYRKVRQGGGGTWRMVQGSTGGSGLRALEPEEPAAIQLSVLYVDRASGELRAYDDIRLGGLGLATAQINRQVVDAIAEAADEVPRAGQRTRE